MGLFDKLLKPAWMSYGSSSDWDKSELSRIKARNKALRSVDKLKTQNQFAKVVKTAPSGFIREKAMEYLTDQVALADIAQSDTQVDNIRAAAIRRLVNQETLADIAKNKCDRLGCAAFCNALKEIICKKLIEQKLLTDVAQKAKEYFVRLEAVKKLTDAQALTDIAQTDIDSNVRRAAVEKLTNMKVLVDIAKTDSDDSVREMAIEKLTDQKVLAEIAKKDTYDRVRMAIAKKLTDQSLAQEIFKNIAKYDGRDCWIRLQAVERITTQETLLDIARMDHQYCDVCKEAAVQVLKSTQDSKIIAEMREIVVKAEKAEANRRMDAYDSYIDGQNCS